MTTQTPDWLDKIIEGVVQYQKNQSKLKKLPEVEPQKAKFLIQRKLAEEFDKGYTEGVIDNSLNKNRLVKQADLKVQIAGLKMADVYFKQDPSIIDASEKLQAHLAELKNIRGKQ